MSFTLKFASQPSGALVVTKDSGEAVELSRSHAETHVTITDGEDEVVLQMAYVTADVDAPCWRYDITSSGTAAWRAHSDASGPTDLVLEFDGVPDDAVVTSDSGVIVLTPIVFP